MKKQVKFLIRGSSVLIAIFLFTMVLKDTEFIKIFNSLTVYGYCIALIACLTLLLSVLVRAIRWTYLVLPSTEVSIGKSIVKNYWNYLFSLVLNIFIPFRVGEIYRTLSSGGSNRSVSTNLIAIIFEKIFDLLFIFTLLLFAFLLASSDGAYSEGIMTKKGGFTFLVITAITISSLLLPNVFVKIKNVVPPLRSYIQLRGGTKFVAVVLGFTALAWFLESLKFFLIWHSLGFSIPSILPLIAFCLATLSLAIPAAPAGVGTFHYAIIIALVPFGIEYLDALHYAVFVHILYFFCLVFSSIILYATVGLPTGFKETNVQSFFIKIKGRKKL